MDRAAFVAAAGVAFLAACTDRRHPAPPLPSPSSASPTPDPDAAVLTAWSASEQRLAALYAPVVHPAAAIAALRANHVARAAAVAEHLRVRGLVAASAAAVAPLRGKPPAVVTALVAAERAAATGYLAALSRVSDPDVAVLGAELAAGARQHATVLRLVTA